MELNNFYKLSKKDQLEYLLIHNQSKFKLGKFIFVLIFVKIIGFIFLYFFGFPWIVICGYAIELIIRSYVYIKNKKKENNFLKYRRS